VAVDGDGNVFVTDRYNALVRKFTSAGTLITSWGAYGNEDGEFLGPTGVAVDLITGDVYVADYGNNRIQKFTSTGTLWTRAPPTSSGSPSPFARPRPATHRWLARSLQSPQPTPR
jgi:DNA-binding beta-propeller fold protein YncE